MKPNPIDDDRLWTLAPVFFLNSEKIMTTHYREEGVLLISLV
jgi:hypothetical protein